MTEREEKERTLIALHREMANLTNQECAQCDPPYSCCDFYGGYYCEFSIAWADKKWGVKLDRLSLVPNLPLMGLSGCTIEPHLRPICSMHACVINKWGKSGDESWTKKYFDLRERISKLEGELHGWSFPMIKRYNGRK